MNNIDTYASGVTLYASRSKVCLLLMGTLLLSLVFWFGAIAQPQVSSGNRVFALATMLLLLSFTVPRGLFLVLTHSPLLIIEDNGIRLEPQIFGETVVPWSSVREISYYQAGMIFVPRKWITITVEDVRLLRFHQNVLQRVLAFFWHPRFMTYGRLILNNGLSSMPMEQVYQALDARSQGKLADSRHRWE